MDSARLLIRMAYICSACETAIRLRVADKMPEKCPYCGVVFVGSHNSGSMDTVEESVVSLKPPR